VAKETCGIPPYGGDQGAASSWWRVEAKVGGSYVVD
jgi:hypothetical protein